MPVAYDAAVPIESFDVVIIDECHRSIYGVWRQVIDYFDAFVIGLTATPNKQAFGFFNQNLVMEYTHEQAVADAVNVDFDVYVGASVLVGPCPPRLLLSDKSLRLLLHPDVDRRWLQLALSSPTARAQMSAVATGTSDSMRNISQEKVRGVRLRAPGPDAQVRIVAETEQRLSTIDNLRRAIELAHRRRASMRRSILERAFRGELVPQDPSDEAADVLLRVGAA